MILKKSNFVIILSAVILLIIALLFIHPKKPVSRFSSQSNTDKNPTENTSPDVPAEKLSAPLPQPPEAPADSGRVIPKSLNLSVLFTSQAPTGNWDELHEETCEETASLMANFYFNGLPAGKTGISSDIAETELAKLVSWQKSRFGYYKDTTAAETAKFIEEVYGLKTMLLENFSEADLKNTLAQNRLVIIPESGQALGNPHYTPPGPIYHMLLVKGYDENGNFITNDPGTKFGQNYIYSFKILFESAADWDHTTNNINLKQKVAIVVWK
ncbi:MAG: C39 family peptidase [Candidatus Doudnabacteria bacterium]|nr:C39 family peptidase [Candidatus Doudnabacteria bacterium]